MSQNSFATPPIGMSSESSSHAHYRSGSINVNLNDSVQKKRNSQAVYTIPVHDTEQPDTPTLVAFTSDDKANPKNWSKAFKWYYTMVVAFTCFVVAFNSSVVTADITGVSKQFGVSDEVSLLTVTLFVVGFGLGEVSSLMNFETSR